MRSQESHNYTMYGLSPASASASGSDGAQAENKGQRTEGARLGWGRALSLLPACDKLKLSMLPVFFSTCSDNALKTKTHIILNVVAVGAC